MVPANILLTEIGEKSSPLYYQFEQATLRTVVVPIGHHMPRQLVYSLGKQGYLDLGRPGIVFVQLVILNDFLLFRFVQTVLLWGYVLFQVN